MTLTNDDDLERLKEIGRICARALQTMGDALEPGMTTAELDEVEGRIRGINPYAIVHRTTKAQVPLDAVLGRNAFDLERILAIEPAFLEADDHDHHDHQHHGGHHGLADGHHAENRRCHAAAHLLLHADHLPGVLL